MKQTQKVTITFLDPSWVSFITDNGTNLKTNSTLNTNTALNTDSILNIDYDPNTTPDLNKSLVLNTDSNSNSNSKNKIPFRLSRLLILLNDSLSDVDIDILGKIGFLPKILTLNRILFELSNTDYEDLTYENLVSHVTRISDILYDYKRHGFVNDSVEDNKIYRVLRSFFIKQKDVFSNDSVNSIFELEHFHNLILLLLVLEIDLYLTTKSDWVLNETQREEYAHVKVLRDRISAGITAPLRSLLSMGRLSYLKRIYTGFDTEYQTIDNGTVKLLCSTYATYSSIFFRIKKLMFDYTITNHNNITHKPSSSAYIEGIILLIRTLNEKNDVIIDNLVKKLQKDENIETLESEKFTLFRLKPKAPLTPTDFVIGYKGLIDNPETYSFKSTVEQGLSDGLSHLTLTQKDLDEFITSLGYGFLLYKIRNLKELYLIAHFTTADVCSWSDFEDIKREFAILRKSFLSVTNSVKVKGWNVFLRDTALLTPTASNLGSIGALYTDLGLSKIDLPFSAKNNMEAFMESDFEKFKEYAIRDSEITLYHALVVQNSHYKFCSSFTIPVTLSALASNYLTKNLVVKNMNYQYHNPMTNGQYGMQNLGRLLSPVGVELSNGLHDYIDFFLGAYHGGRNESYIYVL